MVRVNENVLDSAGPERDVTGMESAAQNALVLAGVVLL